MRAILNRICQSERHHEFIRFCIVGVVATAIHYGIYLSLINIVNIYGEIWTNTAYTIGYVMSWCVNLWMTAHFTFKTSITVKRGAGFAISHLVNYILHLGFLNLFLSLGVSEELSPIPTFCCVVPINFLIVRTVFRKVK